jgi:cyclopropane fatty-acyl-phospholipid synthase-like methyltransferase
MENKRDYSKKDFLRFWGANGYIETWDGHKYNWSKEIKELILNQIGDKKDKNVLEIGCGAGYWTNFLCENSKNVTAIDLIPKPSVDFNNFTYIENDDLQFNCNKLEDNSIDFAFSFGVFCHLSLNACESYLKDVLRVLRKGGTAIFMYSDDKGMQQFHNDVTFTGSKIYGEFNNYSDIMPMIKKYDSDCKIILEFRDSLVLITKK